MDNSKSIDNRAALKNMYGLIIESSYHAEYNDEEIDALRGNKQIMDQLADIKRMGAKYQAKAKMSFFQKATKQYQKYREMGVEKLSELLSPAERLELQPLFRKFEEITDEDAELISNDQELLKLMELLEDKVDSDE
jgi:hypothetical protein